MKKHTAKSLRELANHIPPVISFEPKRVIKTGKELNAIIAYISKVEQNNGLE